MKHLTRVFGVLFFGVLVGCDSADTLRLDIIDTQARAIPAERAMVLHWNNPDEANITSFTVRWSGPTNGTATKRDGINANSATSHRITGLTDRREYRFIVTANIGPNSRSTIQILNLNAYTGVNYDQDGEPDFRDTNDDNDGVLDDDDLCARGVLGWTSSLSTDRDEDGCRDADEDAPVLKRDSYSFEFPPTHSGPFGVVEAYNFADDFTLEGDKDLIDNIAVISVDEASGELALLSALAMEIYDFRVNAVNSFGSTSIDVTLNITSTSSSPPVFSQGRAVIRLNQSSASYNGEPNLRFGDTDSVEIIRAPYDGKSQTGRGDFSAFDASIFAFNSAGNFTITSPIDPKDFEGIILQTNATNDIGATAAFIHILIQNTLNNRRFYFAGDGSVEVIGKIHPALPESTMPPRFEITEGNELGMFAIEADSGDLSVTSDLGMTNYTLMINETYPPATTIYTSNVSVRGFARSPDKNVHYIQWLAENAWLKPGDAPELPQINAKLNEQISIICPAPLEASAFPGPNIWFIDNRTIANRCKPSVFDPTSKDATTFLDACDSDDKVLSFEINNTRPLRSNTPAIFKEDTSYYFASFSGGTTQENLASKFETGAACRAGMKFQIDIETGTP